MAPDKFQQILQALRHQTPFRPFTVELVTGSRFEVDVPEAVTSRDGVVVFLAPGGVPVFFDHESVSQFIGERNTGPDHLR